MSRLNSYQKKRNLYLLLTYNTFVEFDKMQIPLKGIVWFIPASFKISLATIGVCVFVRWLRRIFFVLLEVLWNK